MKISKFLNNLINNQDEMLAVLDSMEKVMSSKKEWDILTDGNGEVVYARFRRGIPSDVDMMLSPPEAKLHIEKFLHWCYYKNARPEYWEHSTPDTVTRSYDFEISVIDSEAFTTLVDEDGKLLFMYLKPNIKLVLKVSIKESIADTSVEMSLYTDTGKGLKKLPYTQSATMVNGVSMVLSALYTLHTVVLKEKSMLLDKIIYDIKLLDDYEDCRKPYDKLSVITKALEEWEIINITQNADRKLNVDIKVL